MSCFCFILVFFSPFSIGEERTSLCACLAFVCFALVGLCLFPLPLGARHSLVFSSYLVFLPSFKSTGILAQEMKFKINIQKRVVILAIFDLQVTLILPTKFQVNWPVGLR